MLADERRSVEGLFQHPRLITTCIILQTKTGVPRSGQGAVFSSRLIRSTSSSASRLFFSDSESKRAASIRNSSICLRNEPEVSFCGKTGTLFVELPSLSCPCNMNSPLLNPDSLSHVYSG